MSVGVGERWLPAVSVEQVVVEHEDPGHNSGHEKLSASEAGKRRLGGGASVVSVLNSFAAVDTTAPSSVLVLCAAAILSPAALPGRPAAPSCVAFASGSVARAAGQAALPAR